MHERLQPFGLSGDAFEEPLARRLRHLGVILQRLDEALDRRQRRLQFVRDVGDEVAAQRLESPQLARVVQPHHGTEAGQSPHPQHQRTAGDLVVDVGDLWFPGASGGLQRLVQRRPVDQLRQASAVRGSRQLGQQFRRGVVGDQAILGVQHQQAFARTRQCRDQVCDLAPGRLFCRTGSLGRELRSPPSLAGRGKADQADRQQ